MMGKMSALKQLLGKGGNDSLELLKALGAKGSEMGKKGLEGLDQQLGKVPGMVSKYRKDLPVDVGADPARRNALLGALGVGGVGAGAASMSDDEDEDELEKIKAMLGL